MECEEQRRKQASKRASKQLAVEEKSHYYRYDTNAILCASRGIEIKCTGGRTRINVELIGP